MSELTNTEIDRKCAKVMGWENYVNISYQVNGVMVAMVYDWHPSTSLDQAWQVEEMIIGKGLWIDYCGYLNDSIGSQLWWCIHATARQRCLACIQAWEGMK